MALSAPRVCSVTGHWGDALYQWQFGHDRYYATGTGCHLLELVGSIAMVRMNLGCSCVTSANTSPGTGITRPS